MTKKDHTQSNHTDIHVESHSEQSVAGDDAQAQREVELTADLQRIQAEFMNFKRRAEAERADLLDFAKSQVVRQFLTVRDTFDQEQAHRPVEVDAAWAKSIEAIRAQFDTVLKDLGVSRFDAVGQPFDPHRHEAVASEGAGTTVVAELQPGYQLGDTVLRPAMVKVGDEPVDA